MPDLIGGNIATISGLAATLQPVQSKVDSVVDGLNGTVKSLCNDAGWSGDAATAMQEHWEVGSVAAAMVGAFCDATHGVLADLVTQLTAVEHALEEAASEARGRGVPVPADGTPPTAPNGPLTADLKNAYASYLYEWTQARSQAQGFRISAEGALLEIAGEIGQIIDPSAGDKGLSGGDKIAIADYIKGIGAFRGSASGYMATQVAKARANYEAARSAWRAARDATLPGARMPDDVKLARSQSLRELNSLNNQLADLERNDLRGLKFLNTSIGDVGSRLPGGLGEAFADAAKGTGALKALSDIPVLDVAAAVGSTYFQAKDDIEKGANPAVAIGEDGASNVAGLAAGAWVGAGVAGVAAAAGAGPVLAVGAGAVVGGAVVIGVGDLVYEGFHENWSQDIHNHGVLGGLAHGTGHMFTQTGSDLKNMAVGIGHGAKSLWHSVFG
jgi:hypothetical protein